MPFGGVGLGPADCHWSFEARLSVSKLVTKLEARCSTITGNAIAIATGEALMKIKFGHPSGLMEYYFLLTRGAS